MEQVDFATILLVNCDDFLQRFYPDPSLQLARRSMDIYATMANRTTAGFAVLNCVIGCTGMRNPFTVLLAVVHDPNCQTRSVLDQLFVIF
jgi:hypothetical protein